MSVWEAIIQGIIQGATEFLPISSSGHLSISQHIFGIELPGILFDIMLHLGTLAAVIFVYRKLIWRLLREFAHLCQDLFFTLFPQKGRDRPALKWSGMSQDRRLLVMLMIGLLPLFLLFLPIPGTGMKVKDLSESLASDTGILAEGLALLATSALLFLGIRANRIMKEKHAPSQGRRKIHTVDALCMGFAQLLAAIFPGLSRSGSTMAAGMTRGLNQRTALDYSFVLGIPAIAAATLVSLKDLSAGAQTIGALPLVAGTVTAAVVGFLAIKLLRWIVTTDKLRVFAYYALIVGGIVTVIGVIEHLVGYNLFTGKAL